MRFITTLTNKTNISLLKEADGILVGEKKFSCRMPAYFTRTELVKINHQCHINGIKCYLNLNRFINEADLFQLREYLEWIATVNFDGIYFNDLAVKTIADASKLKCELIYAPEATLTNSQDIRLFTTLGIDRGLLAKELTLEEILAIAKALPGKVELFGFGHLAMSYSKRPLVSNYLKHIQGDVSVSKKRTLTLKEEKRPYFYPVLEESEASSVFTAAIMNCFLEIPALKKSGLAAIHLDGLFLSDEIIVEVLAHYRSIETIEQAQYHYQSFLSAHTDLSLDNGYFDKKTNLTKEGAGL